MIPPVTRTIYLPGSEPGGALSDVPATGLGTAAAGIGAEASRFDHVHAHGSLAGGSLHAAASTGAAGFMSAADKAKLDGVVSYPAVVRDIDYTAEANATLLDGDVVIGGVTHTVVNVAIASQFDLVNGTGLVMRYATSGSAGVWNNTTQTGPGIYATLGNLIPDFSARHRYLFLWHHSVPEDWDSTDSAGFYLYLRSSAGYSGTFYEGLNGGVSHTRGIARIWNSTASLQPAHTVMNGTTQGATRHELNTLLADGSANPSASRDLYNVVALQHINGSQAACFAGQYDGGWPDIDTLEPVGETLYSDNNNAGTVNMRTTVTRALVGLSGPTPSATPHGVDVHRLRIYDLGV